MRPPRNGSYAVSMRQFQSTFPYSNSNRPRSTGLEEQLHGSYVAEPAQGKYEGGLACGWAGGLGYWYLLCKQEHKACGY